MSLRSFVVLMVLAIRPPLGAQAPSDAPRHSGIAGTVRDNLGHPVTNARILVDGSSALAVSDDSGRFDLRGLPSGKNGFTITKLGFAPVSFEAGLLPDSVIVVAIHMRSVQVLGATKVNAARMSALARVGFTERQHLGLGTFLTPVQVDSIARIIDHSPVNLLRDVRGIDVRCGPLSCTAYGRNPPGCLWLFIDGAPHGMVSNLDSIGYTPDAFAAIEVYERPSIVPMEFQGALPVKQGRNTMSLAGGCGAVAMWTKARIP